MCLFIFSEQNSKGNIKNNINNQTVINPLTNMNPPIPIIHISNNSSNTWRILLYGFLHLINDKITSHTKNEAY